MYSELGGIWWVCFGPAGHISESDRLAALTPVWKRIFGKKNLLQSTLPWQNCISNFAFQNISYSVFLERSDIYGFSVSSANVGAERVADRLQAAAAVLY